MSLRTLGRRCLINRAVEYIVTLPVRKYLDGVGYVDIAPRLVLQPNEKLRSNLLHAT